MKIDYEVKGIKLPFIPSSTEYRLESWENITPNSYIGFSKIDYISYGSTFVKGEYYIKIERESYEGSCYFLVKLSDIETLAKNQKQETIIKTITYSDAQRIVDIACPDWKAKLFQLWGKKIVLKQEVEISNNQYQGMRRACTEAQHKLFDDIFGEDKPKYKIGDWIIDKEAKYPAVQIIEFRNGHLAYNKNDEYSIDCCRLATEEEIKAATIFPEGTPCLVRDNLGDNWKLCYTNGKGGFYRYGKKSGITAEWTYSMKLDMDNLPVNE